MASINDRPPATTRPTFQTRTAIDAAGELNRRFSVYIEDSASPNEPNFGGDGPNGSDDLPNPDMSSPGNMLSSPWNFTKRVLNVHNGSSPTETTPLLRQRS